MKKLNREDFTTKSVIGSVDYTKVKRALTGQNLQELCQIYELFIRFDTQISSEIKTRRQKIAALPSEVCERARQDFARRITGTSTKYQKKVAQAIKRARHLALMPFVADMLK